MAASGIRKIKWFRQVTAWEHMSRWRERRKEVREQLDALNSAASTAFTNAWSNQISGNAMLAGQQAAARVQSELQATIAKRLDILA